MSVHLAAAAAASATEIDWGLLFRRIFNGNSVFWRAMGTTIYIAVISQVLGIALGMATLAGTRSRIFVVRWIAKIYVLVTRGTPPIVEIFFMYYGANLLLGFDLFPTNLDIGSLTVSGPVIAGITALALYEGAYESEIMRGGVDAVEAGQLEAGLSVGMTRRQAMWRIVVPQAARVITPTVGNQFNYMIKATSLLSFIGVYEIFQDAQVGYAASFRPVEYFIGVAIWYIILTSLWAVIQVRIERKFGASDYEPSEGRRLWRPWSSSTRSAKSPVVTRERVGV